LAGNRNTGSEHHQKTFVLSAGVWHSQQVKTASINHMPSWQDILSWVSAGEEVQITDHDIALAKVIPARTVTLGQSKEASAFDLPPITLGHLIKPLTADDDLLAEMLDDTRD